MNWPNRLSVIRVLCIPVITALLYVSEPWCVWAAAVVFLLLYGLSGRTSGKEEQLGYGFRKIH